jgi:hypothetical protein
MTFSQTLVQSLMVLLVFSMITPNIHHVEILKCYDSGSHLKLDLSKNFLPFEKGSHFLIILLSLKVLLNHIANYLLFLSDAQPSLCTLNTSYTIMLSISPDNLTCLYTIMSASLLPFPLPLLFQSPPLPFLPLPLSVGCCLCPPPLLLSPLSLLPPLPPLLPSLPLPLLSALSPLLHCCCCAGVHVALPSCPFVLPACCCQLLCINCWHCSAQPSLCR